MRYARSWLLIVGLGLLLRLLVRLLLVRLLLVLLLGRSRMVLLVLLILCAWEYRSVLWQNVSIRGSMQCWLLLHGVYIGIIETRSLR